MPGLSPGFGGIGTHTAVTPSKYYSPAPGDTSIPVPILGWDNDGDYQVPNDYYTNALYMLNVAECTLGDSPELPPPNQPATDIILMGWQGYLASKARMLEYDDRTIIPIIATSTPVMDWTPDLDNQQSNDYNSAYGMLNLVEYSLGDNPEVINYGIGVITGWDTDADMQISNASDYSIRLDPDDRVIRIFIPTQEIDNDSEQQFSIELNRASAQDSTDTTVRISIPVIAYDNDSENQLQQGEYFKDHLADEAVEKITLVPAITQLTTYDTDAENQISNFVHYALLQEVDDRQVLVPIPPGSARDIILMGWKGYKVPAAAMTEPDRNVELVITPPPPAPTMSSHDIDQYGMISNQVQFTSDDQGNVETINFIILVPFVNITEGLGEAEDE